MPRVKKYNKKRVYKRKFSSGYSIATSRRNNGIFKVFFVSLFRVLRPILVLSVIGTALFYAYKFTVSQIYASDLLLIENIEVTGCNNVTATEIKKLMPFKLGDNLLKINLSRAREEIQKYKPELKTVSMFRDWKNKTVYIELMERMPEVFIYNGENLLGLDFDDIPFSLIGKMVDLKVPIIKYGTVEEKNELLGFLKKSKPYLADFISKIKEIKIDEISKDVVFVTVDGTKIYFGAIKKNENEIENRIKKMKKVINDAMSKFNAIEYVDLTYLDIAKDKNAVIIKPIIKEEAQQKKEI